MADKLARVRWEMGQTLLPEHLVALEDSLLADTIMRFRLMGLPDYGIARLKWNDTLLLEGVLSIQSMTLVMPSGALVNVRANAVIAPFNLNTPGTVSVSVYCHMLSSTSPMERVGSPASGASEDEEGGIRRLVWQLALSTEQVHPDALETLKLAEFVKSPEGAWKPSNDYIPPMVQMGMSPFLISELEELSQVLDLFQHKLGQEIATSYLSGDTMFSCKECLKETLNIQRFIGNLLSQVHLHPYFVYEKLKSFYTEVCFYRDTTPEYVTEAYNHDQLASCFERILLPLRQQIQLIQSKLPYMPFECKDGLYRVALPSGLREAKEVYFLVQKSHVNIRANLESFKMASIPRLPLIHKLALLGVPLKKMERPPFQHRFGPEVDFYLIVGGDEWDQALRDLSLSFYDSPQYQELRFYLYWRMD